MASDPEYDRLLRRTGAALAAGAILVAACYHFVDRPVAGFVHARGLPSHRWLGWLTLPPPVIQAWAPAALAALMLHRARGPFRRWERAALAAAVAVVVADQCRESLSDLSGRYWPDTWVDNNPSYVRDGDAGYGFHPFRGGPWYGSFPSGHTARMAALAAVLWASYPGWRWAGVAAAAAVGVGLVGMNYHFVGDVAGGGVVGGVVGAYAAHLGGAAPPQKGSPPKPRTRERPRASDPGRGR